MGGQGKPRRYFRERLGCQWAGAEGKRKHGLQRALSCQSQKAAKPVWLQGGLCQTSLSFSCKMNLDLPKIKFHMLWAKDYFLFQGLELTTLFLILPSAPAPAPGSRYYSFPAKGSTETKPTWPIRFPLCTHRLTFRGLH